MPKARKFTLNPNLPPPRVYGVDDAAHALNIGRSTIYKLIAADRLRAIKIGRRTLIPADSIDALLAIGSR